MMLKSLWMLSLIGALVVSCRPTDDAQLQSTVLEHNGSALVVSPLWDLHASYQTGYHDSLLRVCQPKSQEMLEYFKLKAAIDAAKNANLLHLCKYNNDLVELLFRIEGQPEPIYQSQQNEGVCFQKTYQGTLEASLETGLNKANLFSLQYLSNDIGRSAIGNLVLKASEVFEFIESDHERAYAVSLTKQLGDDLGRIAQTHRQSIEEYNAFVQSLIAEGKTELHCDEVALIDGNAVLNNLDLSKKAQLQKKAIAMIQGRDLLNKPSGGLEDQRVAFSDPPIHEFTYVLDESDDIRASIVSALTPTSREAVKSDDFKAAEDRVKRVAVLAQISQAIHNTALLLDPRQRGVRTPEETYGLVAARNVDSTYHLSEQEAISRIIQNRLHNYNWSFDDTDFGQYPTEQIASIWDFYVACHAGPAGCAHPPYLASGIDPNDVGHKMRSVVNLRQVENQRLFEKAANNLKSILLGGE